jgi:hypothetical protein
MSMSKHHWKYTYIVNRSALHPWWWPRRKIPIAQGDSPQSLIRVENDSPRHVLFRDAIDICHLNIVGLGTRARAPMLLYDNVAAAQLCQNLASTLDVETIAMRGLDHRAHSLSLARKRNHLHNRRRVPRLLIIRPPKFLRKVQKCRLRLASYKHTLPSLLLLVLKRSRVHSDSRIKQRKKWPAQNGIKH